VTDEKNKKEQYKEGGRDRCEEEVPNNLLCVEEQELPENMWCCLQCSEWPCQFLQWQEELERIVNFRNPDLTNKEKRYQLYFHVSCRPHGALCKGNCRPLPSCFEQGMRDLYPFEKYTGYKSA
jgi:hypothetical protein